MYDELPNEYTDGIGRRWIKTSIGYVLEGSGIEDDPEGYLAALPQRIAALEKEADGPIHYWWRRFTQWLMPNSPQCSEHP